jgi:general secretion pathway protein G
MNPNVYTRRVVAPRCSRAFTLIELLTVIAIIGILASILIPTVTSVREKAKSIQCGVRIRQWAMAVSLYANDRKGFYDIVDNSGQIWCQISTSGTGGIYMPYFSGGGSKNYGEMQQCPSGQGVDEYNAAVATGSNTPGYTAYVLAAPHFNGTTVRVTPGARNISVPLSKAAQPSRTILLIERPYVSGGVGQDTGNNATIDKDKNLITIFQGFTRHNKNFQTVFMDGHVKALKIEDISVGSGRGASFNNTLLQLY